MRKHTGIALFPYILCGKQGGFNGLNKAVREQLIESIIGYFIPIAIGGQEVHHVSP